MPSPWTRARAEGAVAAAQARCGPHTPDSSAAHGHRPSLATLHGLFDSLDSLFPAASATASLPLGHGPARVRCLRQIRAASAQCGPHTPETWAAHRHRPTARTLTRHFGSVAAALELAGALLLPEDPPSSSQAKLPRLAVRRACGHWQVIRCRPPFAYVARLASQQRCPRCQPSA